MMNRNKNRLLYGVYVLAVAVFFIYFLFPSDTVATYVTSRFNSVNPDITLGLDHVGLSFPIGLRLHDARVYYLNTEVLRTDDLKIVPQFLSFFRSKIVFFFKGRAFGGILEGRGEFDKNRPDQHVVIAVKLSGMNIKAISAVKHFADRSFAGMLEGSFTYRKNEKLDRELEAEFIISDGEFELLLPMIKHKSIPFSKLETDISIKNERLKVKRCIIKGDQLDGSVSGIVNFKEPLDQSHLRLSGLIKPNPEFLAKLVKDLPSSLLPKKILSKKVVRIRIYGSLDEPRVFLN